jgi:uncharacterized phage protein gp47/JayE
MTDTAAFNPPALAALIDDIDGDIETSLPGADARLPRSVLAALARAKGGVANEEYYKLLFVYRQLFPQTAARDALLRHGELKGVFPKLASAAGVAVAFTGNDGNTALIGTVFKRADGAQFSLDAAATIVAGVAAGTVTALVPGSIGNTGAGSKLSFVAPVPGIQSTVTVGAAIATGFDAETIDAFRGRVIAAWQKPPQGGDLDDYVAFAKEVAGVTRAWAFKNWMGVGTIGVTFVEDDNPAGIIPIVGDVAAVQAHIDDERKVTADVIVFAPTPLPLTPTIRISPDTADNRGAVITSIKALIAAEAIPGGSISASGVFYYSRIEEAVETSPGIVDSEFTIPAPGTNVAIAPGELLQLGAVTWI